MCRGAGRDPVQIRVAEGKTKPIYPSRTLLLGSPTVCVLKTYLLCEGTSRRCCRICFGCLRCNYGCELGHGDQAALVEQWRAQGVWRWDGSTMLCRKSFSQSQVEGLRWEERPAQSSRVLDCFLLLESGSATWGLPFSFADVAGLCKMSDVLWNFKGWELGQLGLFTPIQTLLNCCKCFNSWILLNC